MRTGILLALALVGGLSAAAPASAQPQSGVARPPDEERLPLRELGEQLYAGNCSMCHGADARGQLRPRRSSEGIMGQGPSLRGVGAQSVDFYLRTGYMPLAEPSEQPERRRPFFNDHEIRAFVVEREEPLLLINAIAGRTGSRESQKRYYEPKPAVRHQATE